MNAAPSLHELQSGFACWVMGENRPDLAGTVVAHGLSAEGRLQIYRNMVFSNLTSALRTAYPAVLKLVGGEFFEMAAMRYILACPSESGNLQDFGRAFSQCLGQLPEAAGLPYLSDMARLEWARQQSFLAADAQPLAPDALADIPDDRHTDLCMTLHPSVRLVDSDYPILDIWGFCQEANAEHLALGSVGQHVLMWRNDGQICMLALASAEHVFLTTLQAGETVVKAHAQAIERNADFDTGDSLRGLISQQLITGYSFWS